MSDTVREIDWQAISARLQAPFPPEDVDFRPQGNPNGSGKAQAVCYVDARTVADRLDEVVGAGAWSFAYEPLVIDKGQIQIAKGRLTIHGVTKEDVGEASNFDASKGCVSDALKRAAVLWGVGRYLYGVSSEWVTLDQYKRIPEDVIQRLRAKLPRPDGMAQNASVRSPQPNPSESRDKTTHSASATPAPAQRVPDATTPTSTARPTAKPDPDAPATAEQRERMRKYRDALEIADRSIATTDNVLTVAEAEARICAYIEQWKKRQMHKSPATPAAAAEHDLSTLGNGTAGGGRQ